MAFDRGEVVLLPFPFTDLSAAKTRPAVVVSPPRFTEVTGDITVAMITSVPRHTEFDCQVRDWREAGLLQPSWVRAKLATLSPTLIRFRPGRFSAGDLASVDARIRLAVGQS